MSMEFILSTTDREVISSLPKEHRKATKIYLVEFYLKSPRGADKNEVARKIAAATNSSIVKKLGATQIERYSENRDEARRLPNYAQAVLLKEFYQRFRFPETNNSWEIENYRS